jgi:serine/threonine protein kinase
MLYLFRYLLLNTDIKQKYLTKTTSHKEFLKEIKINNQDCIQILNEIGSGAFSKVYYGKWDDKYIAVKVLNTELSDNINQELQIMKELCNSKYIVRYEGIIISPLNFMIAMEYMANGSLDKIIFSSKRKIPHLLLCRFILDSAIGLNYIHENKFIHADLATRNIMIDEKWRAKISDFGLSRILEKNKDSQYTNSDIGPVRWSSPETLNKKIYTSKTDIYSFGVVMYEILERRIPWQESNIADVIIKVTNGQQLEISSKVNKNLINIMRKCYEFNPKNRITIIELIDELKKYINNINKYEKI